VRLLPPICYYSNQLVLLFLTFIVLKANCQTNELLNHFQENSIELENLDNPIDFNLDIEEIKNTLFFAQGEVHGIATYERIKLELLKYLYLHAGVRVYVVELGSSHAFLFNQFLQTGSQDLISGFNESETQFWIDLKNFNDRNIEKIEVVGIDFERTSAIRKAFDILLSTDVPEVIIGNIDALKRAFKRNLAIKTRSVLFEKTQELVKDNESIYREYFGDKYHIFHSIIFNDVPTKGTTKRDKYMLDRFITYHSKHPGSKYFGVFGISHANRNLNTLVGMLVKSQALPFENRVTVFSPQYMNCQTEYGNKTLTVDNYGLLTQEKVKNRTDIINDLENDLILIDLEGLEGKYKKINLASDYLIVVKNQRKN